MAIPGVHVLLALVCLFVQAVGHVFHLVQQLWLLHCHGHFGSVRCRDLQGLARVCWQRWWHKLGPSSARGLWARCRVFVF